MGDLAAVLLAIATLITAVGTLIVGLRNSRKADVARERAREASARAEAAKLAAEDSKREIVRIGGEVFELGQRVDGRLSQLLELTETAALAKGRADAQNESPK